MDDFRLHAGDRPAPDALHGALRQAVDHIRSRPIPEDVLRRALEKAQRPERPTVPVHGAWRRAALVAACMAATILIALFMKAQQKMEEGKQLAVGGRGGAAGSKAEDGPDLRRMLDRMKADQGLGGEEKYSEPSGLRKDRISIPPHVPEPTANAAHTALQEPGAKAWRNPERPAGAIDDSPDNGRARGLANGALGSSGGGARGPAPAQNYSGPAPSAAPPVNLPASPTSANGQNNLEYSPASRPFTVKKAMKGGGQGGIGGGGAGNGGFGAMAPASGVPLPQVDRILASGGRGSGTGQGQPNSPGFTPPATLPGTLRLSSPPARPGQQVEQLGKMARDREAPVAGSGKAMVAGQRGRYLNKRPAAVKLRADEAGRTASERRIQKQNKDDADKKAAPVYKRSPHRPTFARVYVGDGNSLDLVSLQVTTTVEGPRARTVVDHIFYNPHHRQLEGTFEYPLPAGASPSYFAMFLGTSRAGVPLRFAAGNVPALPTEALNRLAPADLARSVKTGDWGRLQEAHIVSSTKALDIYESVLRQRIDPALLEYAGGNTFRGRVFPIPANGYNRVILAYEELLPESEGAVLYRYPLPDCKLHELRYTLTVPAADCHRSLISLKSARREEVGGQVRYTQTWTKQGPGDSVRFAFVPPNPQVQAISGRQNETGPAYLYARIRPSLKVQDSQPYSDHAVFMLDTSYSEQPDGFARNVKILRTVLEADSGIKQFNVLAFNVGASWLKPQGWFDNTPAGREAALSLLDGMILEGATDLSVALDKLAHPGLSLAAGAPLNVFLLSDGDITWGESDANTLAARVESACPYRVRFNCYRTGLGADNLPLFDALTRKGGGVFNCLTDNVKDVALAHRRQCLQLERVSILGLPGVSDILVAGRKAAVYPDGDLIVTARASGPGHATVLLDGTFMGQRFAQEYPVEFKAHGDLAPRGWGEVAVASLLALNDPAYDNLVTAYCQQFNIGSRVASFLVLENENDYQRLNLESERGKVLKNGDLGQFLESNWEALGKAISPREAFERFLDRVGPRVHLFDGPQAGQVKALLKALSDKDFELPASLGIDGLVRKSDVPVEYLNARALGGDNSNAFITEANRRAAHSDVGGAVRALSTIIEEFPGRSDALRLVGYRLLDLKQPAQAARLFSQVERQRPFEPHSYLDLARSLEACGRYGLAAVQYEIVLAGAWDARFHASLKTIALEDYLLMMRQTLRKNAVTGKLANTFGERLEHLAAVKTAADLRVTISWNTDNTDIDLWVVEPDGTKCFYQNRHTPLGGLLSEDQTQGFGPERYQMVSAPPGVYTIYVHYFRANPNLLAGETHVSVVITRHADTPRETVERHTVILKHEKEAVEVSKIKF